MIFGIHKPPSSKSHHTIRGDTTVNLLLKNSYSFKDFEVSCYRFFVLSHDSSAEHCSRTSLAQKLFLTVTFTYQKSKCTIVAFQPDELV